MSAPNENARPGEPRRASFGKRLDDPTPDATPQDSALAALRKEWKRAEDRDRFQFLQEVREFAPELWREIEADFVGSKLASLVARKGDASNR